MAGPPSNQIDRQTRSALADMDRRLAGAENNDVLIGDGRRLIIRSPNGHFWNVGVSDAGALVITDLGTSL